MRVCIIQGVMKAYRVGFFENLAADLARHGVQLQVVYGRPWAEEVQRGDNVSLAAPLGHEVPNWKLPGAGKAVLQGTLWPWLRADLVIVEHANKYVLTWALLGLRVVGCGRLAFWGHGRDNQADPQSRGERLKRRSLRWADWWFAYTQGAAAYVSGQGFDAARITAVGNAVDTHALRAQLAAVTSDDLQRRRTQLGLGAQDQVAVYCGSLYANKRLDLLFDAADRLHAHNPRFRLLLIGGGPLQADVQAFGATRPWARPLGPLFGPDKALHLKLASLWLNPGALGLAILDGFVAGLPMITTTNPGHGPEIEYLNHGHNGFILAADAAAYAEGVAGLLNDPPQLARMQAAALADAHHYSIETMAHTFSRGVLQCLGVR